MKRTTRRCAAGSHRPTRRAATSRSRTCPSAASGAAGTQRELAHRRGDRRPGARPARPRALVDTDDMNVLMAPAPPARSALRARALRRPARGQREASALAPTRCCRRRRPSTPCPAASATTPISTPASTTPPRWASCSGPTTRCCPTTSGCRSATTAAPRRSCVSGQRVPAAARPDQGPERRHAAASAPRKRLDYELELGFFVGAGNALGEPIPIERRRRRTCSALALLNDWSRARHPGLGIPAARARSCRRTSPPRSRRGS